MAKYTEHLRLSQPEGSDYYDIEVFNHNSELIDKKIGEMDNSLSTIKEGATREKAGIVQLGTEEGKALEGMMLARLAGCIGYGGDIQDDIVKNPNYIYYDRNTRKMYKCLKQNQDISANVANFIPLDNNSLLDRLENLIMVESYKNWNTGNGIVSSDARLYKIGPIKFLYISFSTDKVLTKFNFKFPITFKEPPYVSYTDNGGGATLGVPFGIDWATTTGVLLSEVQSATMLVVGI
ncbi:hypothetical protein [Fusobacterium nucleatum]|uniref:hypothetical protein n=1 Tax=Fusobacterium nucleatum TaxID=851 RepID=UPI0030CFE9CA